MLQGTCTLVALHAKRQLRSQLACALSCSYLLSTATFAVPVSCPPHAATLCRPLLPPSTPTNKAQRAQEVAAEVEAFKAATGTVPGLAVVLVGARKDSETYVRSKKKACAEAGVASFGTDLPEDVAEDEVLKVGQTAISGRIVALSFARHALSTVWLLRQCRCCAGRPMPWSIDLLFH